MPLGQGHSSQKYIENQQKKPPHFLFCKLNTFIRKKKGKWALLFWWRHTIRQFLYMVNYDVVNFVLLHFSVKWDLTYNIQCTFCIYCGNKRPMGHIAHLRKQFKSINTYDYIKTLIKRRQKKNIINFIRIYFFFIWRNLILLHPKMLCDEIGWNWPSGSGEEDF